MDSSPNLVYIATKGGCVGYFVTTILPDGWKLTQEPILDITDVMRSLACSKEQALKEMNRHWT